MESNDIISVSSFFLRLSLGIAFIYLGALKAVSPVAQNVWLKLFQNIPFLKGAEYGALNALLYCELIIGFALLLGLFTRSMAVAATLVIMTNLFLLNWFLPAELLGPWGPFVIKDIVFLGSALALIATGAPHISLDSLFEL